MTTARHARTLSLISCLAAVVVFLLPQTAFGAAGDLDPTFAGDGVSETPALANMDQGYATEIATLPDGRFLTVGQVQFNSGPADLAVQRHNADGTLDSSFSGDGVAVVNVPGTFGVYAVGVGVQPSGKVVAAAQLTVDSPATQGQLVVYRFNENGTLDDTFDGDGGTGDGVVRLHMDIPGPPNPFDRPWEMIVEPGGRIVVAGESNPSASLDGRLVLTRLTADGLLDNSFDGDGRLVFDPTVYSERGLALSAHPQGGYVVAGVGRRQTIPQQNVLGVARVTDSGALDAGFTGDTANVSAVPGHVVAAVGADVDDMAAAWAVAAQSDGKILVAGTTQNGPPTPFLPFVARLTVDGSFDTGFGEGGRRVFPYPNTDGQVNDIALDPAGRIYAAGTAFGGGPQVGAVARITESGAVDVTYGSSGAAAVSQLGSAQALALQSDGRQLVAGSGAGAIGLHVVRLAADPVIPISKPLPTATITSPKSRKVKRKRLKRFAGTAGPAGSVAKVEIALQRVDKRLLKRRKRCSWLSSPKPKFRKSKTTRGKCSKPRFLRATGLESWSYRLRKQLPKGSYRLLARVTLADGTRHESFTASTGNLRAFRAR